MKKILFNTSLITALSLSTTLGWSGSASPLVSKSLSEVFHVTQDARSFDLLLAMGSHENLKAYHIGLRCIFPHYRIPSAQDLLTSIRSHQQFLGDLHQEEALHRLTEGEDPYFLFEEKGNSGHFYITYSGGLRHFTVTGKNLVGIDNGGDNRFPSLGHFVQSTLLL